MSAAPQSQRVDQVGQHRADARQVGARRRAGRGAAARPACPGTPARSRAGRSKRVEPDDAARAAAQLRQRVRQRARIAGVVAVAQDQHGGARVHQARRMLAVELRQALADARAAGPALRDQVQLLLRAPRVGVVQRRDTAVTRVWKMKLCTSLQLGRRARAPAAGRRSCTAPSSGSRRSAAPGAAARGGGSCQARWNGVPPLATLRRIVAGRSSRRPWRARRLAAQAQMA